MLVVDARVLFEVVADTSDAERRRELPGADVDRAAPHVVDVEVLAAVETHHRTGALDATAAPPAIDHLRSWPGERWTHRPLLGRAW